MFVSVAWCVPSNLHRLIVSGAGNIPSKNASDIFPSRAISEAGLPKFVWVIDSDVGSNASDGRSEFTQAHTRSIASKTSIVFTSTVFWPRQERETLMREQW